MIFQQSAIWLLFSFGLFTPHKFYVSNTQVTFNSRTHIYEITAKIFTDDLELALQQSTGKNISFSPGPMDPVYKELVCEYLNRHFRLSFDDNLIEPGCVGYESETDLIYCYMEIPYPVNFHHLTVENTILLEQYPEQKNIVDLNMEGWKQTLILTSERTREVVTR